MINDDVRPTDVRPFDLLRVCLRVEGSGSLDTTLLPRILTHSVM